MNPSRPSISRQRRRWRPWLILAGVILIGAPGTFAQNGADGQAKPFSSPVEGAGIRPQLNALLPMDAEFHDETGQTVHIRDYFRSGRPVILHLMYFRCAGRCDPALRSFAAALAQMPPDWTLGGKFQVITVSFDHLETPTLAAAKKKGEMAAYNRVGVEDGWHFLTGDEKNIRTLTDAVGFYFKWDAEANQYAHDVALIVISPEGKVTHYLRDVAYDPKTLRLALIDSAAGKVGSVSDRFSLFACYGFDPVTGKYQIVAFKLLRLTGLAVLVLLTAFIGVLALAARRRRRRMDPAHTIHAP